MTLVDIVLTYSNGKQWHAKDIVLESIHTITYDGGMPLLKYHDKPIAFSSEVDDIYEFSKSENSYVTYNLMLSTSTGVELDILADGLVNLEITAHESLWNKELSQLENVLSKLVTDLSDTDKFDIVEYTSLGTIYSVGDMVNIHIVPLAE